MANERHHALWDLHGTNALPLWIRTGGNTTLPSSQKAMKRLLVFLPGIDTWMPENSPESIVLVEPYKDMHLTEKEEEMFLTCQLLQIEIREQKT